MTDAGPRYRFSFRFAVLARQWRRMIEKRLGTAGLSDASWAPLIHLHESGDGITQKELAGRVGTDGSSLVRLLDILERKEFIERRVDAGDRRARLIFLTDAGRGEVTQIRRILAPAEADILADLDDAELELLLAAFRKISRRLQQCDQPQDGR